MSGSHQKASYRAHPVAMLFSKFIDMKILDFMNNELKEISSMLIGSSKTTQYSSEIEFCGSMAYYTAALVSHGATIGHQFCKLTPLHVISGDNGKDYINRIIPQKKFLMAAFFYAFLPYIYARRQEILSAVAAFWKIMTEPENITPQEEISVNIDDTELSDSSSMTSRTVVENDNESRRILQRPILEMVVAALYASYVKLSHESSARMARLVGYCYDLHQHWFALSGRYLEFPLRILNLQLFSESLPPTSTFQIKVQTYGWMIGARVLMLTYYASRVVLNELDSQLVATIDDDGNKSKTALPAKSCPVEEFGQCPLCLDAVVSPTSLPCGHVCCWDCITPFAFKSTVSNAPQGNSHKCPVCRQPFQRQHLRALFV